MTWKDILKEASEFDDKEAELEALDYTIKRLEKEHDNYYQLHLYGDANGEETTPEEYYKAKFDEMERQKLDLPKEIQKRILEYYRMEVDLHYAKEQLIKDFKALRDIIEEFAGE